MHSNKILLGGGSTLLALTLLSGAVLTAPRANADTSGTVDITINVPTACSLSATNNTLTKTINPGTSDTIGTSNIKALCNDANGFAIYAVGYTDEEYGNNYLTTSLGDDYKIATGKAASPSTSQWNMTIDNDSDVTGDYVATIENDFDQVSIIPDTYTKIASFASATDQSIGSNLTAQFDAYIAPTQAAGTYTGKVKFLLVHPNVLTYNDQTGQPATTQPATMACNPETPTLQDVSSWGSSVALGETVEAIDVRDCQTYKVKRLKMNAAGTETALWMSNLNLGAVSLASGVTQLDNTNTNLPNDSSTFISASTFMAWDRTTSGTATSYTDPKFTPVTLANVSNGLDADTYGNKYGTLYNYAAASAGTYVYASGSGTGDAQYSLCPYGWRLPTGGSSGEFQAFYNANSPTGTTMQSDYGFSLAGLFYNSTPRNQGSNGYYWSSTRSNGGSMYLLYFDSSDVYPYSYDRRSGFSVRCIKE